MSIAFARYKRLFRNRLQPVFAMLLSNKSRRNDFDWEQLVRKTIHGVNSNPAEYLGEDLPAHSLVADVLSEIESEFLKDVKTFR